MRRCGTGWRRAVGCKPVCRRGTACQNTRIYGKEGKTDMIRNFSEFCDALLKAGFSMGGGNAKGVYAVIPFGWEEQAPVDSPVKWHTGDPETDPWEWRMRVLENRDDIAYARLFFRTSGYITRDWYPYFLAVRRRGKTFEEALAAGTVRPAEKRVYEIVAGNGAAALHDIKRLGGFSKEENASFDRAVVELQSKMFLTICGRAQKLNPFGEAYGWNSTVFCTVEDFWAQRGFTLPVPDPTESFDKIRAQIFRLNPRADIKKISRFIKG